MRMLIDFSLFKRNRNFRLFFYGYFVSLFGTSMTGVALPYQIYMQTHSTMLVGLLSLVQLLPLLATALWGGALADAHDVKKLALITLILLGIGSTLLAFNAIFLKHWLWPLFVISAAIFAVTGLLRPAIGALRQQLVPREDLPAAGSLMILLNSSAMIAGPAIGGVVIANFGVVAVFLFDAVSYFVAGVAFLMFRDLQRKERSTESSSWQAIINGCRYSFSRQELVGTYVVDFVAMIFGMPTALFPAIALSFGGAKTLGLLYAAPAVGAFFTSFISGWANKIKRYGVAIAVAASLWGVAIIFFGIASNFWVALFFLALAGGFDALSGLFRGIMWYESIPSHLRGRLAGIEMISYLSGPKLGDTEAGLVAAAFGIGASIISGGVLCVVGVAACCYFLPKFWRYQSQ